MLRHLLGTLIFSLPYKMDGTYKDQGYMTRPDNNQSCTRSKFGLTCFYPLAYVHNVYVQNLSTQTKSTFYSTLYFTAPDPFVNEKS